MSKRKLAIEDEGSSCKAAKAVLSAAPQINPEPVIEVSVMITRGIERRIAWHYGKFNWWKALSGGQRIPVHHLWGHRCPKITLASEKVDHFLEVYRSLSYSEEQQWTGSRLIDLGLWTRAQRTCHRAFTDQFYNSSGRNFVDALLKYYIKDKNLDIYNIGGNSPFNPLLNTLQILYDYYPEESDGSTSSEESPRKIPLQKDTPQKDSSFSTTSQSTESDGIIHTPVVDNLIYHCSSQRAYLVVSVKHGNLRKEHEEQLKLELLSMLPTEAAEEGKKQRVAGMLICQREAFFYLAEKSTMKINMFEMDSFDMTVEKDFSSFINNMIALFRYSQQEV